MRVLIVAAVLACAAAAPSGLLGAHYGAPYGHGLVGHAGLAVAHAAPYAVAHAAPALPTISSGDIQGAAIDAHVEASDHVRAASDAARLYHDQASELHGQAVNAAVDHSWQAVGAAQTAHAQLDGAAAGVAPVLAKQLVGHGHAPVVAAPAVYGAHGIAAHGVAPALAYSAPAYASSQTVVSQSLSQSHPAPVVHAPLALAHAAPYGVAHAAPYGVAHAAPYGVAHAAPYGVAHAAPYSVAHAAPVAYAHGLHGHAW